MDIKETKLINGVIARHPWELVRLEVIYQVLKTYLIQTINRDSLILDVGCGDAFVAEQLSKRMTKVRFVAIDTALDKFRIESYKKNKTRVQLFDSLENASYHINKPVDIVFLLDVIEHIKNENLFLKSLNSFEFITNKTFFLITAPAFQSLFCSHDLFLEHYRRYNNTTLKKCVQDAGLKPIHAGYFFFTLLPIRIIEVMIEKILEPKRINFRGVAKWKSNKIRDSILKHILFFEVKVTFQLRKIRVNIPGLSNYIICKKTD